MSGLSLATGSARAPLSERKDDLYETPAVATRALLACEQLPHRIWEPACGRGAIAKVLEDAGHFVHSTDLVDYGFGTGRRDFLMELEAPTGIDCIVTNPPFKVANELVRRALELVPNVAILIRLAFLESDTVRNDLLDGGRLRCVHVFRKRLPMMHRDGWEGKKGNSGMAFAWFVWDGNVGPTELRRISWEAQ